MSAGKNVLIVYAHQEPKSFNGALKDLAEKTLTAQGHTVQVSDLYAMNFDPRALKEQFKGERLKNPDHFEFERELGHAAATGALPEDVKMELEKIQRAELVIFQCPLYWMGLPAMLKGWLDRCIVEGVGFAPAERKVFDNGPYKDKTCVFSMTTGGSESIFSDTGIFGDINVLLWPIITAVRITGMRVLPSQICFAPGRVSEEVRQSYLTSWETRLKSICNEKPLQFIPSQNFDFQTGLSLTEDYIKSREGDKYGPTVGQHLGRGAMPDSLVLRSGH